jgi:hypothetical protein
MDRAAPRVRVKPRSRLTAAPTSIEYSKPVENPKAATFQTFLQVAQYLLLFIWRLRTILHSHGRLAQLCVGNQAEDIEGQSDLFQSAEIVRTAQTIQQYIIGNSVFWILRECLVDKGKTAMPQLPITSSVTLWKLELAARGSTKRVKSEWLWISINPGVTWSNLHCLHGRYGANSHDRSATTQNSCLHDRRIEPVKYRTAAYYKIFDRGFFLRRSVA